MMAVLMKIVHLMIVASLALSTSAIRCHTCISFVCATELSLKECEELRSLVIQHVATYRDLQNFGTNVPNCPLPDDNHSWQIMESSATTCIACGKTGFTIKYRNRSDPPTRVPAYGLVMGCTLNRKYKDMFCSSIGGCNAMQCSAEKVLVASSILEEIVYSINFQSCTDKLSGCTNCDNCKSGDFCIPRNETVPLDSKRGGNSGFREYHLRLVILGAVVLCCLIAGLCCHIPRPRVLHGTPQVDQQTLQIVRTT